MVMTISATRRSLQRLALVPLAAGRGRATPTAQLPRGPGGFPARPEFSTLSQHVHHRRSQLPGAQNSGRARKNPGPRGSCAVGGARPSTTAHAHSANDPEFSTLRMCADAGRLPVECRIFVTDVVQTLPSKVRDSTPLTQHDATACQ